MSDIDLLKLPIALCTILIQERKKMLIIGAILFRSTTIMDIQQINYSHLDYHFSSDKSLMQWEAIHDWLSQQSYWVKNIPFDKVKSAGEHSFCIGIFYHEKQIGYARIVTDYYTFGYLADVYIMEEHRKKGLSKLRR